MQADNTIDTEASGFRSRRSRRWKALTLIEAAMALGLFALAAGYAVSQIADYMEHQKARTVAEKMVQVSEAAAGYVKANYASLVSSTAIGSVRTIAIGRDTATAAPPANSVQAQGFLPNGFVDVNGFGQRHALLVKRVSDKRLEALVTTYSPNRKISDRLLTLIGTYVGNTGGYVLQNPPVAADANKIMGVYGGYRSAVNDWAAGAQTPTAGTFQSSLAFEDGKLLADYLYRNDIGIAEANRMNTAIDMKGNDGTLNDINNGGTFNSQHSKAQIDVWAGRNVTAGEDVAAGRDVVATRDVHANRNVVAEKDVEAYQDLRVTRDASVGRNLKVTGDTSLTGKLMVKGDAELTAMNLTDTIVFDNNRFNKSVGMKLIDLLPRQVAQYSYAVVHNDLVPKPTCTGGDGNAKIFVFRQVDSTKATPYTHLVVNQGQSGFVTSVGQDVKKSYVNVADGITATTEGKFWRVKWVGDQADGATRKGLAQTYCYYG
jgi:Bacterial shufflon protein, N-terminal constant region.